MLHNDRVAAVVSFFAEHGWAATADDLTAQFGISERTLRMDLAKANRELEAFEARIKAKRGHGYRLLAPAERLPDLLQALGQARASALDTAEERIGHLVAVLLFSHGRLSQDDLANEVFVSVNTVAGYVRAIRDVLGAYNLSLEAKANLGYLAVGSELDKRKCLFDLLASKSGVRISPYDALDERDLARVREVVDAFKQRHKIRISDYSLAGLCTHIALAVSRVSAGFPLAASTRQAQQSQLDALGPVLDALEAATGTRLPAPDRNYIAIHIAARAATTAGDGEDARHARLVVERILACIADAYRIDLAGDRLLVDGMRHHMQSIISAKRVGMSQDNPLTRTIKTQYILAWEMAQTAAEVALADEPFVLSEGEIGYIALHLSAALERMDADEAVTRIAVLTESSVAEGHLLAAEIQARVGRAAEVTTIRPINEAQLAVADGADLALATGTVSERLPIPLVQVRIPLLPSDWKAVRDALDRPAGDPVSRIEHYFEPQLFRRLDAKSKDEVLDALCCLVEGSGIADETFRPSVMERERRIPTAMNGMVAIPHPLSVCCSRSRVAVGLLDEPVLWSPEHHVRIVLMLALSEDQRDITMLYDTLVLVMNDRRLLEGLACAPSLESFLDCIRASVAQASREG